MTAVFQDDEVSGRRRLQTECSFICPSDAEDCEDFTAYCVATVSYYNMHKDYWEFDERHTILPSEYMYQSTTLSTKGEEMWLYNVPFDDEWATSPVDVCSYGFDPCDTDTFSSPVDVVDCDGNLCS